MTTKTTEYFMSLPWPITTEQLPHSEGGGFYLSIALLGPSCRAFGETKQDAMKHLEELARKLINNFITNGTTIKEPK